jgi:hypothetical protein
MKQTPKIYQLERLIKIISTDPDMVKKNGKWVPSRPISFIGLAFGIRLHVAWKVFTGKADAVVWPEDE